MAFRAPLRFRRLLRFHKSHFFAECFHFSQIRFSSTAAAFGFAAGQLISIRYLFSRHSRQLSILIVMMLSWLLKALVFSPARHYASCLRASAEAKRYALRRCRCQLAARC